MDVPSALIGFITFPTLYGWTRRRLDAKNVVPESGDELDAVSADEKPLVRVETPAEAPKPQWKVILMKALPYFGVFKGMPINAILLALVLGFGFKLKLPMIIDRGLEKIARCNSFISMVLLGMMLDISPTALRKYWRDTLAVVVFRNVFGVAMSCILYFGVGKWFGVMTRCAFSVVFLLPTATIAGSYAIEFNFDPSLAALITNVTMVVSFGVLWLVLSFVPLPNSNVSSSVNLSSSNSVIGLL